MKCACGCGRNTSYHSFLPGHAPKVCRVPGCGLPVHSLGYCNAHRLRYKRKGRVDKSIPVRVPQSLAERFEAKVNKKGAVPTYAPKLGRCWIWTGAKAKTKNGSYGVINRGKRGEGLIHAHRLSYKLHKGKIPDGLELDHLCRITLCVNPRHLEPVTRRVNVLRARAAAKVKTGAAHAGTV
jgi:hypothetical protein